MEERKFLTFVAFQAKPNCLIFLDNDTVVVGGESKEAQVISQVWCCFGDYIIGMRRH